MNLHYPNLERWWWGGGGGREWWNIPSFTIWIRIHQLCGSVVDLDPIGSVFGIRIRIHTCKYSSVSDPDVSRVFSPIRIRVLKVRIRIHPVINLWDLNDGFEHMIRFWRSLTKKDNGKSARYEVYYFFLL